MDGCERGSCLCFLSIFIFNLMLSSTYQGGSVSPTVSKPLASFHFFKTSPSLGGANWPNLSYISSVTNLHFDIN